MLFWLNGVEWYINHYLAQELDSVIYNIHNDMDFVIIISGDRMVRIGKSVLAQLVAAYLVYRLKTPFTLDKNIFWKGSTMAKVALTLPKHSVVIGDEINESANSEMASREAVRDILNFLNDCGQLNHILIFVADDWFSLKEKIAIGRSEYLLNCYRDEEKKMEDLYNEGIKRPVVKIKRGQFTLFNRYDKAKLFDENKRQKQKNYWLTRSTFNCGLDFRNQYLVDEAAYRARKWEFMSKRSKDRENILKPTKTDIIRDRIILNMTNQGINSKEIEFHLAKLYNYNISDRQIRRIIEYHKEKEINSLENSTLDGHMDKIAINTVEGSAEVAEGKEEGGASDE